MSRLLSLMPTIRTVQYVLIAVVAFSLGGATVVQAVAPGGIMGVVQLADRTDTTRLAAIDASGNVGVKVSNFPATQPVSGTVGVAASPTVELTRQILNADIHGDFNPNPSYFDVSSYGKVRITVGFVACTPNYSLKVYVTEETAMGTSTGSLLDQFEMLCGDFVSRSYDVPGTWLRLLVHGGPDQIINLTIYGHQ